MKRTRQHMVLFSGIVFLFVALILPAQSSYALKPTFEAYQKVLLGHVHAGFAIQRYTFDPKHKIVTSISYTYVKAGSHETIESIVAKSDFNFDPISYQYTALVDGKPVIIDAHFANDKMTAIKIVGKKRTRIKANVPSTIKIVGKKRERITYGFLSSFLNYDLLAPVNGGLSVGKEFKFYALAEETAKFIEGTAEVLAKVKYKGVPAFKIKFSYPDRSRYNHNLDPDSTPSGMDPIHFIAYLSYKGEALGTDSPAQNAKTVIASKASAIKGLTFNAAQVRKLFGDIPAGVANQVYGP